MRLCHHLLIYSEGLLFIFINLFMMYCMYDQLLKEVWNAYWSFLLSFFSFTIKKFSNGTITSWASVYFHITKKINRNLVVHTVLSTTVSHSHWCNLTQLTRKCHLSANHINTFRGVITECVGHRRTVKEKLKCVVYLWPSLILNNKTLPCRASWNKLTQLQ